MGVNTTLKEKTLGEVDRVCLYTAFGHPHTSCGCFEGLAFYIPEVDGMGLVYRDFKGKAINGLSFSSMADSTAGGRQVDGFHGVSIEYLRSPKFLQVDGGWNRIVWMPSNIKERVKDFIPKDVFDKIATEKDVETIDQLKNFLQNKKHPVIQTWKDEEKVAEKFIPGITEEVVVTQAPTMPISGIPVAAGGFKIILKDAKIVAKKLIIRKETKEE